MPEHTPKKKNIILIGFMGTGKSSIARKLHDLYDMKIAEMDQILVEQEKMSIPDIFAQKGEPYFRNQETQLLFRLQKENHLVISCGGGAALRAENIIAMKENGYVFLLTASAETIFQRVGHDLNRPVLNGRRSPEGIAQLMETRRRAYEKAADCVISTENKNTLELAEEIMQEFQKLNT